MPDETSQSPAPRRRGGRTPKKTAQKTTASASNNDSTGLQQAAHDAHDTLQPNIMPSESASGYATSSNETNNQSSKGASPIKKHTNRQRRPNMPDSGTETGSDVNRETRKKGTDPQHKSGRRQSAAQSHSQSNVPTKKAPEAATPAGNTTTPAKAYAGPNFHASPAASSLPLPKFFSRSVPNVDKTTSLKHMMENESTGPNSESEESPFDISRPGTMDRSAREESPLDVFFRADREEKARKSQTDLAGDARSESVPVDGQHYSPNLVPRYYAQADESPSRNATNRHHVRHLTDSSTGGMFSLEMDSNDPLHAQSLALKQMLQTPGSSARQGATGNGVDGPFASPSQAGNVRASGRLAGTPPEFPRGLETPQDQRRAALLALAEKQVAPLNGQTMQRPPSSGLRKEVKPPLSPVIAAPPTPTPSRRNVRAQGGNVRDPTAAAGNTRSLQQQPQGSENSVKTMEDDLRRILKLDGLGGVSGVRS